MAAFLAGLAKGVMTGGKAAVAGGRAAAARGAARGAVRGAVRGGGRRMASRIMGRGGGGGGGASRGGAIVPYSSAKITKQNNMGGSLDGILGGLIKTSRTIENTLQGLVSNKKLQNKETTAAERNAKKAAKESGFEALSSGVSAIGGMAGKIPFFDRIKSFFMNILLGALTLWVTENIDKIIETITNVFKFFEDVWEMLDQFLFQPISGLFRWISTEGAELINQILEFPPIKFMVDPIKQELEKLKQLFPDLERMIGEVDGEVAKASKASGGTYEGQAAQNQYNTEAGGLVAGGGVEQGSNAKEQVSKAGFGESEFLLYRDVVAQIESKGEYNIQGGSGNNYAGRYQMGADARKDAAKLLGETYQGDSAAARKAFREDKQMQERYFAAYTRANHNLLTKHSPEYRGLTKEGKLQVLGYAHNAGWSNAEKWLRGGMSDSFKDGFGTRSDKYSTSIRAAQEQRRTGSLPPSARQSGSSTGGQAYGTGLKTGPSAYIGGSTGHHIDTKLRSDMSMEDTVAYFDQMAKSYEAQGRIIEFSNNVVGGQRYKSTMSMQEKQALLQRAAGAHASRAGYRSFDYFVPLESAENRWHHSSEGAEIFAPTSPGGHIDYSRSSDYGNFVIIYDASGREIGRTGHGDNRYGRSSGRVQTPRATPPPAYVEPPSSRSSNNAENVSRRAQYEKPRVMLAMVGGGNGSSSAVGGRGGTSVGGGGDGGQSADSMSNIYLRIQMANNTYRIT